MKKIFFFDLDGTILDPQTNSIPNSTINALKRLKENGHFCGVATGRAMESVIESKLAEVIDWDGFVCSNGQQVFLTAEKALYEEFIEPESIRKIEEYALLHDLNLQYGAYPPFLLKEKDEAVIASHSFFHEPIPTFNKKYENENTQTMMVYSFDSNHFKELAKIQGISVYPGQAPYADIIDSTHSKYQGIKSLLIHYNMEIDSYIAFGDSLNDVEMFEHAKLSIAMGNANPKLKETADVITRSVDQDGIYTACKVHRWI